MNKDQKADVVAQAQQAVADVVAQEDLDEATASELQQCMDDLLSQEGLL